MLNTGLAGSLGADMAGVRLLLTQRELDYRPSIVISPFLNARDTPGNIPPGADMEEVVEGLGSIWQQQDRGLHANE